MGQENEYVLANIFNPESSLFKDIGYIRETAEDACTKAERAFGAGDPIHVEALINLSLFHWQRRQDAERAAAPLRKATELLALHPEEHRDLIAELIATQVLVRQLERRNETDLGLVSCVIHAIERALGSNPAAANSIKAVDIFTRMIATALCTDHKVMPFLVATAGRPFALELASLGFRSEAVSFLRDTLVPLLAKVWGPDADQTRSAAHEADWIERDTDGGALRRHQLDRLAYHLRALHSVSDEDAVSKKNKNKKRKAITARYAEAHRLVQEIVVASYEDREELIEPAIHVFEELRAAIEDFAASTKAYEDREELIEPAIHVFEEVRAAIEDFAASTKAYDFSIPYAGQILLSLACLYRISQTRDRLEAEEVAIGLVNRYLKLYYLATRNILTRRPISLTPASYDVESRSDTKLLHNCANVILADLYAERTGGDPEDNLNQIFVYTDSLDLEKHSEPYHWALAKLLRGLAFVRREGRKNEGETAVDPFPAMADVTAAISFFKEALEVFEPVEHPFEWAQVLLLWSDAVQPSLKYNISRDVAQGMHQQLLRAEEILNPLVDSESWARIQINLSRIGRKPTSDGPASGEGPTYFGDAPIHILSRAQLILHKVRNPRVWALLEREKARYYATMEDYVDHAIDSYRGSLATLPEDQYREIFPTLCELAEILYDNLAFAEACDSFDQALKIGQARINSSYSMHARRVAIFDLKGLAQALSYCYFKIGRMDSAARTMDLGQSILLNESLRTRYAYAFLTDPDERSAASAMGEKIRGLEADGYGGMGSIENMNRLIRLREEFNCFGVPPRDAFSAQGISEVPPGTAILMPLITRHGSVAYIFVSEGGEGGATTERIALGIPDLTSDTVQDWLFGEDGAGWFAAYKNRNVFGPGEERFNTFLEEILETLGVRLLAPVLDCLDGFNVEELVIVPSNGLQFLPVHAAFVRAEAEKRYLDERYAVRFVPSIATHALLRQIGRPDDATRRPIVVGVGHYENAELAPLPNAEAEARALADILKGELILNEQATPQALSEKVGHASVLHLACHGEQWAEDPDFGMSFSPPAVLHLRDDGLAFRDILVGWDLSRADLVTLSACDTGLVSLSKPWDEFEGLTHIVLQAGARAVVGSLWSVDDESTALLMLRFYENLVQRGLGTAMALREAQRWLRHATHRELLDTHADLYRYGALRTEMDDEARPFEHPYFWAPFFLTGIRLPNERA